MSINTQTVAVDLPSDQSETLPENRRLWLEELVRETDHYYQGEIQQDQRASWLLATAGVLIAILVSMISTQLDKGFHISRLPIVLSLISLSLSTIVSILSMLPFRGTKAWGDLFGQSYRRALRQPTDTLISQRFRHGVDWSLEQYGLRIQHHYRSHYLRFLIKAYGVVWSAILILFGLICLGVTGIALVTH